MIVMSKVKHGFTVKGMTVQKGFLYGYNLRGQVIFSSGWTCGTRNVFIRVYTYGENGWKADWMEAGLLKGAMK